MDEGKQQPDRVDRDRFVADGLGAVAAAEPGKCRRAKSVSSRNSTEMPSAAAGTGWCGIVTTDSPRLARVPMERRTARV
ncbi:MAG: hypothetical protein AB7F99_06415 [Vicinamibacterales bacterium]